MDTGRIAEYEWLEEIEGSGHNLRRLIQECPEVFLEKCIVITSFDSGPLIATKEELEKGWEQHGDVVVIPRLEMLRDLPFDQNDEMYVFHNYTKPEIPETFVNDGIFRLASAESYMNEAIATMGSDTDIIGAKYRAERLSKRQNIFWDQLRKCKAESFIGNGHRLSFVSRDSSVFSAVLSVLKDDTLRT